jgi:hypothetical protein
MRHPARLCIPILVLGLAPGALAQGSADEAWRGFYLGLGSGLNTVVDTRLHGGESSPTFIAPSPGLALTEASRGWKLFGGYQLSRGIGVELGYAEMVDGRPAGHGGSFSSNRSHLLPRTSPGALSLELVGSVPMGRRFGLQGRVGVARWWENDPSSALRIGGGPSPRLGLEERSTDVMVGAGLYMSFTERLSGGAEWQRFTDVSDSSLDLFRANIHYRF